MDATTMKEKLDKLTELNTRHRAYSIVREGVVQVAAAPEATFSLGGVTFAGEDKAYMCGAMIRACAIRVVAIEDELRALGWDVNPPAETTQPEDDTVIKA